MSLGRFTHFIGLPFDQPVGRHPVSAHSYMTPQPNIDFNQGAWPTPTWISSSSCWAADYASRHLQPLRHCSSCWVLDEVPVLSWALRQMHCLSVSLGPSSVSCSGVLCLIRRWTNRSASSSSCCFWLPCALVLLSTLLQRPFRMSRPLRESGSGLCRGAFYGYVHSLNCILLTQPHPSDRAFFSDFGHCFSRHELVWTG